MTRHDTDQIAIVSKISFSLACARAHNTNSSPRCLNRLSPSVTLPPTSISVSLSLLLALPIPHLLNLIVGCDPTRPRGKRYSEHHSAPAHNLENARVLAAAHNLRSPSHTIPPLSCAPDLRLLSCLQLVHFPLLFHHISIEQGHSPQFGPFPLTEGSFHLKQGPFTKLVHFPRAEL